MSQQISQPKIQFSGKETFQESRLVQVLENIVDCEHKTAPYTEDSEFKVVRTTDIKNGVLLKNQLLSTNEEAFKDWTKRAIPKYGEILFTREAPAGESVLVPKDLKVCLGQRMVLLKPNESKVSGYYLSHFLQTPIAKDSIQSFVIGTTVSRINIQDICNIRITYPTLPEQQKIASFLTAVDTKIEQLTQKLSLLEQYKKGTMQQIFSQEIRFKDENDNEYPDWEEKKLEEVLKIGNGRDYKDLESGNIPVYGTGGIMTHVNRHLHDGESVGIGRKGTIDKPVYLRGKFWTVDTLFFTHSFVQSNPKYIYYVFLSINWKKYNEASGVPSLSKATIEKIKIELPSLEEQTQIANFLSAIDDKIALVSTQLENTQQFKKGLLQQMFV